MATALSLIIPANNEAALIERCLEAVLASDVASDEVVQIIVVANGCTDPTAALAQGFAAKCTARGWALDVLELAEGNKLSALDAADAAATSPNRAYLDADVTVSRGLILGTIEALGTVQARYVSGKVQLAPSGNVATRAYGRFYRQVPFMRQPAPGCGFFALNAAGRSRWGAWPRIISDDTFARLNFVPSERHQIAAPYDWPLVDGLSNLIRVRRRQNAGVLEISRKFPALLQNDSKEPFAGREVIRSALRAPLGCAVYGLVALIVKLMPDRSTDWSRGR